MLRVHSALVEGWPTLREGFVCCMLVYRVNGGEVLEFG